MNTNLNNKQILIVGLGNVGVHSIRHLIDNLDTLVDKEITDNEDIQFFDMLPKKIHLPQIEPLSFSVGSNQKFRFSPSSTESRLIKANKKMIGEYHFAENGTKCTNEKPYFTCCANTENQARKKFTNYVRNKNRKSDS